MKIVFENNRICQELYGERESHLRIIEKELDITCQTRGNELFLEGPEDQLPFAQKMLQQLYTTVEKGST